MSEPIKLVTPTEPMRAADPATIAYIEEMLDRAKDGQFNGIAVVTITSPRSGSYDLCGTGFAGAGLEANVHTVLGGIDVLHARLMAAKFGPDYI